MPIWTKDYISPESVQTLYGLFRQRFARNPNSIAYQYFNTQNQKWTTLTWEEVNQQVQRCRAALKRSGIQKGQKAALMLRNCPQWIFFEQACNAEGIISVPLYPNDRPDNVSYICNSADVKIILIEDSVQFSALNTAFPELENVPLVISLKPLRDSVNHISATEFSLWLESSEALPDSAEAPEMNSEDLATIVYTSGTTGRPKGVMLSHKNILMNAYLGIHSVTVYKEDIFLSFLPLSHTLERTVGYYIPMMTGASVAFARSVPQLAEDLITVKPTVLISVPRIYERVYGKIQNQLEEKSPVAKKLFALTEAIGWERFEHAQGRAKLSWRQLLWPLLNKLVAKKVLEKLGGNIRFTISGGAPLPETVSHLFVAFGLRILQGYGLTETSPVISVNQLDDDIPVSIGAPLQDIEVRIAENGELQTRSDCVMLGYWQNEDATREMFSDDGWLKTGDIAKIENGHLFITGRIKEILVLSNGEKIPPVDMETAICLHPLFEQALVLGEGKPFLSCILVLEKEHWQKLAKDLSIDPAAHTSLKRDDVKNRILKQIALCLSDFPGYAQIRQVTLSLEPWTDENSLLTPSLKLRRKVIIEHFSEDIAQMYKGH